MKHKIEYLSVKQIREWNNMPKHDKPENIVSPAEPEFQIPADLDAQLQSAQDTLNKLQGFIKQSVKNTLQGLLKHKHLLFDAEFEPHLKDLGLTIIIAPGATVRKPRSKNKTKKGGGRKSKNAGRVIEYLTKHGETSQGDIGKKLDIAGISLLINKMKKDGLVKSRRDGKKLMWKKA
jgi:hypothetical protein